MADLPFISLTPGQIATLEKFLRAGFKFVTFERYARYLAVEKDGFIALLDPAGGKLTLFSQVGYHIGDGIGMLVEKPEGKAFVWHGEIVPVTPQLLAAYARIQAQLRELLEREA
jgi:hypothetical protein